MKKIFAIVLAVLMLASVMCFTSCGAKGKTLAEVKEAGKLVVATSPDFPPFESIEGGKVAAHSCLGNEEGACQLLDGCRAVALEII